MRHIRVLLLCLASLGLQARADTPVPPPALGQAASPAASLPAGLDAALKPRAAAGEDFLPVEQAFRLDAAAVGSDRVRLTWQIAPGYYLYRARIHVTSPGAGGAQLGNVEFPAGQFKSDEYFGRQEIYHQELVVTAPVVRPRGGTLELPLEVSYQGCAEAGLCYPPVKRQLVVTLGSGDATAGGSGGVDAGSGSGSEQSHFARLVGGNLLVMLGGFYLAGLLLAFTPCVLPMVPILSGIIAGGRDVRTGRAFVLSLTFVLGMALTYTAAGVVGAALGREVQAAFQQWWIVALFAAVFVAMGLSMLGLYTVQMPVAVQTRIVNLSNRQSAGTLGGVAVMGALSALIVTTCVGPALVGALLFISRTGQMVRGGAALFSMALGMGTPLLVVGASAGRLLPRTGPWMELVKKLFGVMMLAVAAWMLARIVPGRLALVLWAVPALVLALLLLRRPHGRATIALGLRAGGLAAGIYGLVLAGGAALGGTDPLAPIPAFAPRTDTLAFRTVKSVADLEHEVALARAEGRGVMLDFSAEWCTSCKEMERYTFSDPRVKAALSRVVLLRADVTQNDATDQALLHQFGIIGPPTIAFYGADGRERPEYRVVGYMKAEDFAARSRAALRASS